MKNTTTNDLNAFETGLTQVNEDERILPGSGILLDNPFLWDGTSNLVIEICFSGNVFLQTPGVVETTTTNFNSNAWGDVNGHNNISANGCNLPYLGSSGKRPNITLHVTPAFVNTDVFLRDGFRNAGAFEDLDDDGFIDAIVGNFSGGAVYFKGEIYDVSVDEPIAGISGKLGVFPNPGAGKFKVDTKNRSNSASLTIYDLTGRLVKTQSITEETTEVDLNNEANGIYLFIVQDGNEILSQKVIKE